MNTSIGQESLENQLDSKVCEFVKGKRNAGKVLKGTIRNFAT